MFIFLFILIFYRIEVPTMFDISLLNDFIYDSEPNKEIFIDEIESGEKCTLFLLFYSNDLVYIKFKDTTFGLSWSFINQFPSINFYPYAKANKETNNEQNPFVIDQDYNLFCYILIILMTNCVRIKDSLSLLVLCNLYDMFQYFFPNHIYDEKESFIFQELYDHFISQLPVLNLEFYALLSYSGDIYNFRYTNKKKRILLDDDNDISIYRKNNNWFELHCNRMFLKEEIECIRRIE